jgi:hypothetical protein
MPIETVEIEPGIQKRVSPRSRQIDVALRAQVEALYKSGYLPAVIAKQTGLKKATIATWADRYRWREARDKVVQQNENGVVATVARTLEHYSAEVQGHLSGELLDQAQVLREHPPRSVGDLIKGRAATVKTVVDAADKLFGWDNQAKAGTQINFYVGASLKPKTPQSVSTDAVAPALPEP